MFRSKVDLMNVDDYDYVESIGKFLSGEFTNRYKELLPYNSRLSVYPINIYDMDLAAKDSTGLLKAKMFIHVDLVFKDAYGRSIANDSVCNIPFSYFKNNVIIEESPIDFKTVLKCSDELDGFIKRHLGATPTRDNN